MANETQKQMCTALRADGQPCRAWAMPEGNFAATLLLRPVAPPAELALRSFAAWLRARRTRSST